MLFPWILLFNLLTIYVDNYKQSEPSKVWIQAKPPSVSRNVYTKYTNSNSQLSLEGKNPKQLSSKKHDQPGKNKVLGSSNGNTQNDHSDRDVLSIYPYEPMHHGLGKRPQTSKIPSTKAHHVHTPNTNNHKPIHPDHGLTRGLQTSRNPINKDYHVPDPNSNPHQHMNPDHGLEKRHQTSRKARSPGQAVMHPANRKSVSSKEMGSWIQGKSRFSKIQFCVIGIKYN